MYPKGVNHRFIQYLKINRMLSKQRAHGFGVLLLPLERECVVHPAFPEVDQAVNKAKKEVRVKAIPRRVEPPYSLSHMYHRPGS